MRRSGWGPPEKDPHRGHLAGGPPVPCATACPTGMWRSCSPSAASRSITSPSTGGCSRSRRCSLVQSARSPPVPARGRVRWFVDETYGRRDLRERSPVSRCVRRVRRLRQSAQDPLRRPAPRAGATRTGRSFRQDHRRQLNATVPSSWTDTSTWCRPSVPPAVGGHFSCISAR